LVIAVDAYALAPGAWLTSPPPQVIRVIQKEAARTDFGTLMMDVF